MTRIEHFLIHGEWKLIDGRWALLPIDPPIKGRYPTDLPSGIDRANFPDADHPDASAASSMPVTLAS